MSGKRIAVVGSGVAGLSAAWLLSRRHEVRLYERNHYLGGHSNTVDVQGPQGPIPVDTGFVVYNERNYPQLTGLFGHLGIETQATDMSFAASLDDGRLEYAGSNLRSLFAQRRNLLNPVHWRMLRDILRFNSDAKRALAQGEDDALSLGEFLARGGYAHSLAERYLLPMAAAIWSCPTETMRAFPAQSFFRFFENHGLLDLANRPQWRTVVGGSRSYVRRLAGDLEGRWQTRRAASCVRRTERGVEVYSGGEREAFDEVVLACHADEALRLLDDPSRDEARFLGAFGYQRNRTLLHTDPMLMPRRRSVWSSWNYIARSDGEATREVSVSYWMNRLHRLQQAPDIFVSLNPLREPRAEHRVRELDYMHPVFDQAAVRAQSILGELQGRNRLWFCGAYTGYGFHEDALRSAVGVAQALGVQAPWEDSPARAPARPAPAMTGEAVLP